jgi:ATP phosphoribosyltransferase regulatory subunit
VGALREIGGAATEDAVRELEDVFRTVRALGAGENIRLDFSIVNDMNYYNGIIFQGFVDGIPTGILSGGRYDNLMQRFGKKSGAIGFAVYLDLLERLEAPRRAYDVDVLLVYDETAGPEALAAAVRSLTEAGRSVRAVKGGREPENIKYRYLATFRDGRLEGFDGMD